MHFDRVCPPRLAPRSPRLLFNSDVLILVKSDKLFSLLLNSAQVLLNTAEQLLFLSYDPVETSLRGSRALNSETRKLNNLDLMFTILIHFVIWYERELRQKCIVEALVPSALCSAKLLKVTASSGNRERGKF